MRLRLILALLLSAVAIPFANAQRSENALSDREIEQVREAALYPDARVLLYQKFLDTRIKDLEDLLKERPRPGLKEDIHDAIEHFTSIADELEDNLEQYGQHHSDLRKPLPKLLIATERWASALKSPPDDSAYKVSRQLAIEVVSDMRDQINQMIPEQQAWFKEHPPKKEDDKIRPVTRTE